MQAFNLFIAILLGGVGYANSLFLVLAQTFASAYFVLRTLFTAMQRRSMLVKVMACMIPMVLGGTYIIIARKTAFCIGMPYICPRIPCNAASIPST